MELVGVLPSAEDEVNVACFHPYAGGGLVYGTKVCFLYVARKILVVMGMDILLSCPFLRLSAGREAEGSTM